MRRVDWATMRNMAFQQRVQRCKLGDVVAFYVIGQINASNNVMIQCWTEMFYDVIPDMTVSTGRFEFVNY